MNEITANLPYSDDVRVRFRDTDAQGHLYFANYLVYADEVAGHYMDALGMGAMNPQAAGVFFFTVNINCDYLDECKAHDVVTVHVGYSRLGNSSAQVVFTLTEKAGQRLLARGSLTQVFVDPKTRKPIPIPDAFRSAIVARQPELAG